MSLDQVSDALLWCIAINIVVLLSWLFAWNLAGNAIHRFHSRWFRIERAAYDAIAFQLLGGYKIAVWLFFVVPWIALRVVA